jgi:hypothetical protein
MMHPGKRPCNGLFCSTDKAPARGGIFLKSRGKPKAQREFEVKDGAKRRRLRRSPISAFTRVFDALWAILEFKFSLRSNLTVRFKERWLQSSSLTFIWIRSRPVRCVPSPQRGEGQVEGVRESEFLL